MMTPKWLEKNAEFIAPHTIYPDYLEILPVVTNYERALQVQIVPPNLLKSTDSITVKATVAYDTELAKGDHDPIFGISDGALFIGFIAYDIKNYPTYSPCSIYESDVDGKILTNYRDGGGPKINSQFYSTERIIRIRPTEQLGFCHTYHDAGYLNTAIYEHTLDLSKGIYFAIYHQNAYEKYRIKYIEVDVDLD